MGNLNNKISIFIDEDLKRLGNKEFAKSRSRLIGEKVISYGVKTSEIRQIAKRYFRQFQGEKTGGNWLEIVEDLLSTKVFENQMVGIFLLGVLLKTGGKLTIPELEKLITRYIDNWATSDTMSSEVVAAILKKLPEEIKTLDIWINSRNIWLKRVALVTVAKLKNQIDNWQEIALKMLSFPKKEKEPILKKAVHWIEKELS